MNEKGTLTEIRESDATAADMAENRVNNVQSARPQPHRIRHTFAAMLMVLSAVLGTGILASPAEAATVGPGASWGQVDLLLDSYETEQARRSFWAATVICWNSGVPGKLLAWGCLPVGRLGVRRSGVLRDSTNARGNDVHRVGWLLVLEVLTSRT